MNALQKSPPWFTALALAALALELVLPLEALARAGGGGHYGGGGGGGYHGGGYSGGGYHGGYSGGGFSFWPLLFLGHGSGFWIIIALIVVYYLWNRAQANARAQFAGPV